MVIKVSQKRGFYYRLIAVSIMAILSILFVHVSSAMAPPAHKSLNITSTPNGANITIDGKDIGKTPLSVTIVDPKKTYSIVLELKEYDSWNITFDPNSNDTINANLTISAPAA